MSHPRVRTLSTTANAIELRARRHYERVARASLQEYRAELRDAVQRQAEALRREARRNPRSPAVAVDLVTRLEHHVISLAPPLVRLDREDRS